MGLAGAVAVGRLVESLLFGVTGADPVVLITSVLIFVGVAALAAHLPARRAAHVAPAAALRSD